MEFSFDLPTLSKSILYAQAVDTPDIINVVVPEENPPTTLPKDQVRLESYVRLKSLPLDVMRLILCITEARSIGNKIAVAVPFLPKVTPSHYPSGIVEMQWKLDAGGVFGIILHNFSFKLEEKDKKFSVTRSGKISWRFHGPGLHPQNGDFESVDDLIDFMKKCFIET